MNIVTAIATVVIAAATIYYAYITNKILKNQWKPLIEIYAHRKGGFFREGVAYEAIHLCFANHGNAPAIQIEGEWSAPDFSKEGEIQLRIIPAYGHRDIIIEVPTESYIDLNEDEFTISVNVTYKAIGRKSEGTSVSTIPWHHIIEKEILPGRTH
jgi:hypothetical protein